MAVSVTDVGVDEPAFEALSPSALAAVGVLAQARLGHPAQAALGPLAHKDGVQCGQQRERHDGEEVHNLARLLVRAGVGPQDYA